ncbi:MAG: alkaline phosphatase family protein [Aureispira sp.]|nr:alkaline phosphatase family protein [Aureispira sp.]
MQILYFGIVGLILLVSSCQAQKNNLGKLIDCEGESMPINRRTVLTKIAFGSCALETKNQPILDVAVEEKPDLFIYLGDNIYGDTENMKKLAKKYNKLCAKTEFQNLQQTCPILATWDDHDYGANDAGLEYPMKEESKELFLSFWGEPQNSSRRKHKGIYTSYLFGKGAQVVQIILLDTRTFRTPLLAADETDPEHRNSYRPNLSETATLLGEDQWKWLAKQFEKPAVIRIIGSSTQFGIEYNGYEAWANFPVEKQKMLRLIKDKKANGVCFISGDVHYAEVSKVVENAAYPVYDFTSSGITQTWSHVEENGNRVGEACSDNNFGLLEIDWKARNIIFKAIDVNKEIRITNTINISELRATE